MAAIEHPTYMEHVRHFFEAQDYQCMHERRIDLSTYASLKARSTNVYLQTRPPNAQMPPQAARQWDADRSETFLNWIRDGHPRGEPDLGQPSLGNATRIRKNAADLDGNERQLLIQAFQGIMARPPNDPLSYFKIAGVHWFPDPHCQHHVPHYHPWHRAYLMQFEDALRSVPGCESVTLPYWDITGPIPDFLAASPFDQYTLPADIHPDYPAGYATTRQPNDVIARRVKDFGIPELIDVGFETSVWESFNASVEGAHDLGHPACGEMLATPDAAAFDPLFWFFHSNWDRLWWRWQQIMQATTLWTFRTTVTGPVDWLEPPLNGIAPFSRTADQVIDLAAIDVGYTTSSLDNDISLDPAAFGHVAAVRGLGARPTDWVSVRVKGIDRLNIPGTFFVRLSADGVQIAQRAFFQSFTPRECDNCRHHARINIDFHLDHQLIAGRAIDVAIDVVRPGGGTMPFPLSAAGGPTINARLLLAPQR